MDIDYELGKTMRVHLDREDFESLASRGFCTYRKGLVGHDSKTWVRYDTRAEEPRAVIDGDADINIDIPPDQQFPFVVARNAISARNGDKAMVDWYFHDGFVIEVQ